MYHHLACEDPVIMFRYQSAAVLPVDVAIGRLPSGVLAVAVGDLLVGKIHEQGGRFLAHRPDGRLVTVRASLEAAARALLAQHP